VTFTLGIAHAVIILALLLIASRADVTIAATRSATDRDAGVRFDLDGKRLKLRLVPQPKHFPPDARGELFGKMVRASCGTSKRRDSLVTQRVQLWPDSKTSRTFRFRRDISRRARWCLIEGAEAGDDIAYVSFRR
jgi:hypothetical protein